MLAISASLNSCRSSPPIKLPILGDHKAGGYYHTHNTPKCAVFGIVMRERDGSDVMGEGEKEKTRGGSGRRVGRRRKGREMRKRREGRWGRGKER